MSHSEWQLVMIAGFLLDGIALLFFLRLWLLMRALCFESGTAEPAQRFSTAWLLPAWRVHRKHYTASELRRSIAEHAAFVASLLFAGLLCTGFAAQHLRGTYGF